MLHRLTENVFIQDNPGDPRSRADWSAAHAPPAADPAALTHVVQFYRGGDAAQQVQQLTAASILRAQANAGLPVQLLAAPLNGETDYIPQGFSPTTPLQRTIADLHKFQVPRRLPLLFDILDVAAAQANPAGYLIYTNSDICLNPDFYNAVRSLLKMGFDALIINRRTVANIDHYASNPHLAAFDVGAKHPGFDCFVFPTQWVQKFLKTESCIGVNWVMRPLLYNLVALGNRVLIARDMHLTYHYGDDRAAGAAAFNDYTAHNQSQLPHSLAALCRERGQFQKLQAFCTAHEEMLRPTIHSPSTSSPGEVNCQGQVK